MTIPFQSRRSFLKLALASAAYASLGSPLLLHARKAFANAELDRWSPISAAPSGARFSSADFNGDEIDRPHEIIWDRDNYIKAKGGIPAPSERARVVVVGGGVAGLASAYWLRDLEPVLLEQASRFGGNSKGERVGDSEYSIGAAYISQPDEDSLTANLLREIGLWSSVRAESGSDATVLSGGRIASPFWDGETDPSRASDFRRIFDAFTRVREQAYPDVPGKDGGDLSREQLHALDRMTFAEWAARNLGTLPTHVEEFLHEYCWSSFGGSLEELSAAQTLNFLSADLGGTIALPGGNSAIARELYSRSARGRGDNFRTGAFVVDIKPVSDGVHVCYETAERKFKTIHARTCVVASPKSVARFVVNGLSPEQNQAMARIRYRAYVVSNVLIKKRIPSASYELFRLTGKLPESPRKDAQTRPFTDLIFASWAGGDRADHSVLTLYKSQPYEGARQFLFNPNAHEKHRKQVEDSLPEVMGALGLSADDVSGIRMTRWGHAIPLAAAGMIASGQLETASRPVGGRIFFANQDNWANPCFETAIGAAELAVAQARKAISA